mmetsp:Transcript_26915/g.77617  ORF Transcript_26915/g.77617 Transcript_26915/m.77617 type:complete len:209 (+) Transcript_26915:2-628(+)
MPPPPPPPPPPPLPTVKRRTKSPTSTRTLPSRVEILRWWRKTARTRTRSPTLRPCPPTISPTMRIPPLVSSSETMPRRPVPKSRPIPRPPRTVSARGPRISPSPIAPTSATGCSTVKMPRRMPPSPSPRRRRQISALKSWSRSWPAAWPWMPSSPRRRSAGPSRSIPSPSARMMTMLLPSTTASRLRPLCPGMFVWRELPDAPLLPRS